MSKCRIEDRMVRISAEHSNTGRSRWALRPIDACIADIVGVLNMNGVPTDGSCCGHGEEPGSILLTDGRELRVHFPEDYEHKRPLEGEELVRAFATLFDDDPSAPPMTDEEMDEFLRDTGHDPDEVGRKMARVAEEAGMELKC